MDGSNLDVVGPAAAPATPAAAVVARGVDGGACPGPVLGSSPITRIIAEAAAHCTGDRISVGELAEAFGDRAFGLLILILLLPALLPLAASVFGTPVLILGVQMGLGMHVPRLPGFVRRVSIKREDLLRLSTSSSKALRRVEKWLKPRPGFFTSPAGDKIVGWLSAYVAIMLILPGPGTNAPPAFGNMVMALGVIENDNRIIGLGVLLTTLGCAFATAILVALAWGGMEALRWFCTSALGWLF